LRSRQNAEGWKTADQDPYDFRGLGALVNASRPKLRLYLAGDSLGAQRALASRKHLIDALRGQIDIEIVDILVRPELAETAGILATPTLSDDSTTPPRRLVGDINDADQVLSFFGYGKKDIGL
jgi:circadian clock protein KaiB